MRPFFALLIVLFCSGPGFGQTTSPPTADVAALKIVSRLPAGADRESSGIVRSRKNADLFWAHDDSGNEARLYPIHRDGLPYRSTDHPDVPGVLIENATNVDWEGITALDDGTLVIADLGNNGNARQDLALYFVDEPSPTADRSAPARRLRIRYPEQTAFPPPSTNLNFDCEAIFSVGQTVFVLTKHRSDRKTKLYRLDDPLPERVNTLTLLCEHDIGSMVVAADCDPTGKRLLVLTYQKIWLFERDDLETPFFQGRVASRPFFLPQAEAICFAGDDSALMTDEIADTLFELPLSELRPRHSNTQAADAPRSP